MIGRVATRFVAVSALLLVIACKRKAPPVVVDAGGASDSSARAARSGSPKDKAPATTSFSIAGGNLDGMIEQRLRAEAPDAKIRAHLVQLLLTRGEFTGRIKDYEKATEVAEQAVRGDPKSVDARRARASVYSALHRWDDARADLDAAAKLGADADELAKSRASISMARGEYDEAARGIHEDARDANDLVMAAVLAGLRRKDADAERLFDKARRSIRDVSPFPVAWAAFERARWHDARGNTLVARDWYAEALSAIPVYTHAAVHLAASDTPDKAIERLLPLVGTSDDPEVLAALAAAHRRAKHDADAKRFASLARARYEELLGRHPKAFADHAARFFLEEGEAERALALATDNARWRSTEDALDLWMGAAAAANAREAMCASAAKLSAFRWVSPERKRLAEAMLSQCQ